jgi:two-component system chemotaxis response regulator CheY
MRILLVDDNALTRYTIKSLLDKLGHEVVAEAEDGAGAVKFFTEMKPDLVFLDLILPGRSGVEILEDLRAVDPAARVVIVTAVEQDEIDRRLSKTGVSAILRKPFSYDDFKTLMKGLALP